MYDLIIIGSGPAGLSAAVYGKRAGLDLLVIEEKPMSGGQVLTTYDDAEQVALYKQMERNLAEHAANVYIQAPSDLVAVRNGLEGLQFYPIYVMDLSTLRWAE